MQLSQCQSPNAAATILFFSHSMLQDVIKKRHRNKPREACVNKAREALQGGRSCLIDRCNFDAPQRHDFLALARELGISVSMASVYKLWLAEK